MCDVAACVAVVGEACCTADGVIAHLAQDMANSSTLCACDGSAETGSSKSGAGEREETLQIAICVSFAVLACAVYLYTRTPHARRRRGPLEGADDDAETVSPLQLESAKSALVVASPDDVAGDEEGPLDDDDDDVVRGPTCAVCLDDMTAEDDLVRPPACAHVFHRACIASWIDQAASKAKGRADRKLSCPVCARPILPPSSPRGDAERRAGADARRGGVVDPAPLPTDDGDVELSTLSLSPHAV